MYYVPLLKIVLIGLIMVILRLPDLLVDRFVGNYKHRSVSLQDAKLNNIRVNFTCCSVYLIKHTLSDVELAFFLSATKIHTSKRMNFESKLHRAKPSAITCAFHLYGVILYKIHHQFSLQQQSLCHIILFAQPMSK